MWRDDLDACEGREEEVDAPASAGDMVATQWIVRHMVGLSSMASLV